MIFSTTSHIGLIRKENQDAMGYLKTDSGELFIVCDGVGGLPNGALASKTAVDSILADFASDSKGLPEIQLKSAITLRPEGKTGEPCFRAGCNFRNSVISGLKRSNTDAIETIGVL